jgi:putative chitinase
MPELTQDQFVAVLPRADPARWLVQLNAAMAEWDINTPQRMAAFLAQIAHESGGLTRLQENLNYSAKRLCEVWPKRFPSLGMAQAYANNPEKLANRVYAGRLGNGDEQSGDGWRYRGRGLIQVTGRSNYKSCADALASDVIATPDLLLQPGPAARSAAWFWGSRGLNELADSQPGDDDEQDFVRISIIINGGRAGLKDRLDHWEHAREVLAA